MLARYWSNITRSVKENKPNSPRSRPHRENNQDPDYTAVVPVLMLDLLC